MNSLAYALLVVTFLFGSADARAQVGESVSLGDTCTYFGEQLPKNLMMLSSNKETEQTINRIVKMSGLTRNFEIRAASISNAAAIVEGGRRYILYNPNFIREVSFSIGSEWAAISILAHEVGHHLNGHTLDRQGSQLAIELDADYFSGYVLQKLGADLQDARVAMDKVGNPVGSSTHPAKYDRLSAIASGWAKACDQDVECYNTMSSPMPAQRFGPDSCQYARNGRCEEPRVCQMGTDTTDCRITRQRPNPVPPGPQPLYPTWYCSTQVGRCVMVSPLPSGSSCYCNTRYGPVFGIAQ